LEPFKYYYGTTTPSLEEERSFCVCGIPVVHWCFYVILAEVGEENDVNVLLTGRGLEKNILRLFTPHTTHLPTSAPTHQTSTRWFLLSATPAQAILSAMSRRTLQTNFVAGLVASENTHPVAGAGGCSPPRAERMLATDTVARLDPVTEGTGCVVYVEFRDTYHFLVSVSLVTVTLSTSPPKRSPSFSHPAQSRCSIRSYSSRSMRSTSESLNVVLSRATCVFNRPHCSSIGLSSG
jgi:hypothetical protein